MGRVYGIDGVQVSTDVTMTEVGSLAFYRGDMPTAVAGKYYVRFFDGSTLKAEIILYWDSAAEITLQTLNVQIAGTETDLKIRIDDAALIPR